MPNLVSNHLTSGLLNYIHTTGRYASGINLFEKLRSRDIEISSLLARVLIAADEEVQAVKLLHEAIELLPMDYSLLSCQSTFCQSKSRLDLALECAKRSVTAAPSEFGTWAKLAEIYVGLEQWDLALLTLNSCPMFTHQDKDAPRMPEPARVLLPVMPESMLDELDESQQHYDLDHVHPSLRKLHGATYKGTFLKAYSILTEVTSKIGWDQLLRVRSQVFVMEEEYRSEKQTTSNHQPSMNHNASTTALRGTPSPRVNGQIGENHVNDDESDDYDAATLSPENEHDPNHDTNNTISNEASIEKPEHTIASEVVKAGNDDVSPPNTSLSKEILLTPPSGPGNSPPKHNLLTHNFTTSACASAGSIICSWFFMMTCASIPFGAPQSRKTLTPRSTRNPPRNGKFLANLPSVCTTSPKRLKLISAASGSDSLPRR